MVHHTTHLLVMLQEVEVVDTMVVVVLLDIIVEPAWVVVVHLGQGIVLTLGLWVVEIMEMVT